MGYRARKRLETRDIDLYVGIPFCPTRCAYCSFVSQSVERSFSLVEPYVKALIAEIRAGGEMARKNRLRPRTFYMGGGTPTTLTADQMDAVLTALEESFDLSAFPELTVEAGRPDTKMCIRDRQNLRPPSPARTLNGKASGGTPWPPAFILPFWSCTPSSPRQTAPPES